MSQKRNYIYILITFALIWGLIIFFYFYNLPPAEVVEKTEIIKEAETASKELPISNFASTTTVNDYKIIATELASTSVNQIIVDFIVEDKKHSVTINRGSTIYDAMIILTENNFINFKANHYIGLGYFVQEINGHKNSDGNYWIVYINGVYSSVGISQYILKEGDKIEWKYEN